MAAVYDVIVLGAGVQGSATAYYLTNKAGVKNVLLLEQFAALHSRGSSHGNSRITRRAYDEPFYVKMMDEAFKMWSSVQKESSTELYIRSGILTISSKDLPFVKKTARSLKANNIDYVSYSASEVNEMYPKQLSLPSDVECVFEKDGGILKAAKAVEAYQKLFVSAGGKFLDEHPVTEIVPGDIVTVRTPKGEFQTRKLIITAGAWAPALLKKTLGVELPCKIQRPEILYWKVETPEDFLPENFPTFVIYSSQDRYFYGLPVYEYPGLIKIGHHGGPEIDPDSRDAVPQSITSIEMTAKIVETFFKGVSTTPSIVEPCIYTDTPDWHPFLDTHPEHSNIVIGAGFSGHGFKLSPVIGKVLSELALGLPPSYDLSPFKLNRFQNKKTH